MTLIPNPPDFISRYLNYVGRSEAPVAFHRWSAIGGLGTFLGRSVWFEHGSFKVYPNLYIQLFGGPGTRKSTAIKQFTKILRQAGFRDFAAEKTSKEKFIEWMASRDSSGLGDGEEGLWQMLDGEGTSNVLINADEFNDFFSTNILDFISFLGVMWDYEGSYEHSTRSGGTVIINNPNISILSGNTPTTLAKTIPPEAIGQGFFSRVVIVNGSGTGIKIAFPSKPPEEETEKIVEELRTLKDIHHGAMYADSDSLALLEHIYVTWKGIDDPRFEGYKNRRFNQLLKLCIIHAIAAKSDSIGVDHVLRANTVLTRAEKEMPQALGEFGASRNSLVNHAVVSFLSGATSPVKLEEIWTKVHTHLDKLDQLSDIIRGLIAADKVQLVVHKDPTKGGFLAKQKVEKLDEQVEEDLTTEWDYLSTQERTFRS